MKKPGEEKLAHLFQPGKVGKFTTKNRIKYGACCVSNYNTRDGFITDRELARTKVIAETGCGIVTNQGAYPDPKGEGKAYFRQVALYDDKFLPQFEKIAGYIHDNGAVAIQQILHAGRYGGIDLGYCVQPSVVPQTLPHFRFPREVSKEEIRQNIKEHAEACKRAIKAGFDGVEVTSFMGYLLANFNSKFTNQRTDEYGGSLEKRGRFMRELIYSIKEAVGDDHPLIVRLNGAELMDRWGGNDEDECFELMKMAADCGLDMISVTVGWQEAPVSSIGRDVPPGHWNRLAARAKKLLPDLPIAFGVRLPDPVMANESIEKGEFDFWEVCRPLLADPQLVHKAAEDRLDEVRPCLGDMLCLSRLFRDLPYLCTCNPALGHEVEPEYQITPAAVQKKIMIVGGGPAGMECAIRAAQRGHEVTIFERGSDLGGNLTAYAAHDLANPEDLEKLLAHYKTMVNKLGIEVQLNTEVNPKLMRSILHKFDVAIVATGARVDLSALPDSDSRVVSALDAATGAAKLGNKVVVLGAGKIGLVLAEFLKTKQVDVSLVEEAKRIGEDVIPSWKWRHTSWVSGLKIPTFTSSKVVGVGPEGVTIANEKGESFLAADTVIAAAPRKANQELFQELEFMVDE
ncbi:MAG TPA: FAD-dependent oxidoreductase, partial [Verrucomicrobiae bacterium]|nr:FAD-dependent oxidoreductase [Verrucomicrobiae bacterium]